MQSSYMPTHEQFLVKANGMFVAAPFRDDVVNRAYDLLFVL